MSGLKADKAEGDLSFISSEVVEDELFLRCPLSAPEPCDKRCRDFEVLVDKEEEEARKADERLSNLPACSPFS
jgi:hypothetical protein